MLGDALAAALPELRAHAESRMESRCRVLRLDGGTTTNGDGMSVPSYAAIHTDLPLRLGGANDGSSGFRVIKVGQTEVRVAIRVISVPAATTNLRDDDLIDVTSGEHAGLVLQIIEATGQDQATARRMPVFEVQRPEGVSS